MHVLQCECLIALLIMAVILTDSPVCTRKASADRWSKANTPRACESIQVEIVWVVDVAKALETVIAIWQQICLPVCTCVLTMGTWSKANTPRNCESIQVEVVGVVDVAKALESITSIC